MWRSCIGLPSQPKLALSLPIKGLTYWLADRARWRGTAPSAPLYMPPAAAGKPYNRHYGQAPLGLEGSKDGAFQYSRRGLRLRRRGAYGIHRASGPRCQGLCRKVASLRSGGRRLAVRTAMECHFDALPCTPFCLFEAFTHREACHWIRGSLLSPMNPVPLPPQGETRDMRRKKASHILQVPFRHFPPLVAGATTFPPQAGAL